MQSKRRNEQRAERGSVLIEFAVVSLLLYLLLAATVELGKAVFYAQAAQNAARVAARELALTPGKPDDPFEVALAKVFEPRLLYVDLNDPAFVGLTIDEIFEQQGATAVNQALRPLMIFDRVVVDGATHDVLRYPGAVWIDSDGTTTVKVPLVVTRASDGVETIEIRDVIEQIPGLYYETPALDSRGQQVELKFSGIAAVRVNVPFQASSMSGFQANAAGPFEPNMNSVIVADDAAVSVTGAGPAGSLAGADSALPTYAGAYGLGRQYAFGKEVRPFRKLITGQALFRREVFSND